MDISELIPSQPVGIDIDNIVRGNINGADLNIDYDEEKKKKIAKDFESILIHQLLDKMKDTIPESDLEDSSSKQIKSMYWSFMAQEVADKGGLGLWRNIYERMLKSSDVQEKVQPSHNLNEKA